MAEHVTGVRAMPACLRHLDGMLKDARISVQDYNVLMTLYMRDLYSVRNRTEDPMSITEADSITVSQTINPRELRAISRVLNTAELLEMILVHLPATDLLHSVPLACKGFQAATLSSLTIKRHLFRAPDLTATPQMLPLDLCGFRLHNRELNENTMLVGEKKKVLDICTRSYIQSHALAAMRHWQPGTLQLRQPPITAVTINLGSGGTTFGREFELHLASGITLMHVAILCETVRLGHDPMKGTIDFNIRNPASPSADTSETYVVSPGSFFDAWFPVMLEYQANSNLSSRMNLALRVQDSLIKAGFSTEDVAVA
ncbi:hypothetical protein LTR85_008474 [Meristemomyces frigidus]|nr:hypothetical protein LTR85_008474 [Meristemomyces frigidus]